MPFFILGLYNLLKIKSLCSCRKSIRGSSFVQLIAYFLYGLSYETVNRLNKRNTQMRAFKVCEWQLDEGRLYQLVDMAKPVMAACEEKTILVGCHVMLP